MHARHICVGFFLALFLEPAVYADQFQLLTGVDAGLYPGAARFVSPTGFGYPGTFYDGDRLAGSADVGPTVVFQGTGRPLIDPNHFGSLSFMFRRGTIPAGGPVIPLMGIDFLGGPLLDLDGDLNNATRSLIPVANQSPVLIPNTTSFIDLDFDLPGGEVLLANFDATATNEGAPNITADIAVVVVTIAGTEPDGSQLGPTNPAIDTRVGTVIPFPGSGNNLATVYHIEDLGFELWQDSINAQSSTASTLGTFQYLGTLSGWLVQRDPSSGQFPVLAGQGLGSTLWPLVDVFQVGNSFNTANGLAGGLATITDGVAGDMYSASNNGGLPLADFTGDLGEYLDEVVVQLIDAQSRSFIYLESAGFGINNSFDPVYTDTVSYDVVLIAQRCLKGNPDLNESGTVNASDLALLLGSWGACGDTCCPADFTGDGMVNASDLAILLGSWG